MSENIKSTHGTEPPQPSEAEVVQALYEVEHATKNATPPPPEVPYNSAAQQSPLASSAPIAIYIFLVLALAASFLFAARRIANSLASPTSDRGNAGASASANTSAPGAPQVDPALQSAAENILARLTAGDPAAADQIFDQSASWTGKTHRTPKTNQLLDAAINLKDLRARAAALQALLALDNVPRDASGFELLKRAVENPRQRKWALWDLGALGNSGVDQVHTAKVIEAYLGAPEVDVRSTAVMGLSLLATDETIPMLLDRFRNDPSPMIQETAACAMAESGMYTHDQRMQAAATLVSWLDDSTVSPQQHLWILQALGDISGQNFGSDSAAWRSWFESNR